MFLKQLFIKTIKAPKILKILGIIQFFTWFGLYGFWIYFSMAIAQSHVPVSIKISSAEYHHFLSQGAIDTNYYLSIYQYTSIIFAIFLFFLNKKISVYLVHGITLLLGFFGIILFFSSKNNYTDFVAMIFMGIMWGSVMTLPYVMLIEGLGKKNLGVYLGLFNITITIPQVISGFILSLSYNNIFNHHAEKVLQVCGFLF